TINPLVNIKPRERTKTVRERPLFPRGRPHLIAVSNSVDAKRAVPAVLSHAGIDPAKTFFVEATVGTRVADIETMITPETEAIVIWNLPALVRYRIQSFRLVLKVMRELQLLAYDRKIAVISVTKATNFKYPIHRERVAGSNIWTRLA